MFKFRAFQDLVKISKEALASGKKIEKTEEKATEKKEQPKKETTKKEEKKDYSAMTLAELKTVAKEQGIKGYSTMKKEELLENLK